MEDLQYIKKRLDRLELYNRRLTFSIVLIPLAMLLILWLPRTSVSQPKKPDFNPAILIDKRIGMSEAQAQAILEQIAGKTITANAFVVADPVTKKTVAKLYRNPKTNLPELVLFDTQGIVRAKLALVQEGMSPSTDLPQAVLNLGRKKRPGVKLYVSSNDNGGMSLYGKRVGMKKRESLMATPSRILMEGNNDVSVLMSSRGQSSHILMKGINGSVDMTTGQRKTGPEMILKTK